VEKASVVFSPGHDSVVGSLLRMIHLSVVCCGRAVPLLWRVLERVCAAGSFNEYQGMLRKARWVLRHQDVMLLADRGNACP